MRTGISILLAVYMFLGTHSLNAADNFGNDLPWPLYDKCSLNISELSGLWKSEGSRGHFYVIRNLKEVKVNQSSEYLIHMLEYVDSQDPLFEASEQVKLGASGFWLKVSPFPGKYHKGKYVVGVHSFKEPKNGSCDVHLVTIKNIGSKRWLRFRIRRVY